MIYLYLVVFCQFVLSKGWFYEETGGLYDGGSGDMANYDDSRMYESYESLDYSSYPSWNWNYKPTYYHHQMKPFYSQFRPVKAPRKNPDTYRPGPLSAYKPKTYKEVQCGRRLNRESPPDYGYETSYQYDYGSAGYNYNYNYYRSSIPESRQQVENIFHNLPAMPSQKHGIPAVETLSSILRDEGLLPFENLTKKDNNIIYYEANADPSGAEIVEESNETFEIAPDSKAIDGPGAKIMGGSVANIESWPWQVGIYAFDILMCGGTLFANRFVLTAAHCFNKYDNPAYFKIYLGKSKKSLQNPEPGEVKRSVQKIILHPSYNRKTFNNDIAVLYLTKSVLYSSQIIRTCLPNWNTPNVPNLPACFVTGYGATKGTGGDDSLKVASIDIFSMEKCRSLGDRFRKYLTENMFCAGDLRGGTDSCQGDSGGPLVCEDPPNSSTYVLHGLVSFGWGCGKANSPGVYTRVSKYYNFLKHAMSTALNST